MVVSIFGDVKANFMDLSTRVLFPQTYEEIKQRMIAEYSQISTRKPQTVFKVLRGDDTRRYGEASFKAEEDGCHICRIPGHFYRTCKFFNKKYSLEQNQRYYKKKHGVESNDDVKAPQGEPIRGGVAPRAGGATGKRGAPNNRVVAQLEKDGRTTKKLGVGGRSVFFTLRPPTQGTPAS